MKTLLHQKGSCNTFHLSTLKNDGKIYIMDNHMAAAWCWGQKIDFSLSYNLFHIDKHYDLLEGGTDIKVKYIQELNFDIKKSTIEEYCSLSYPESYEYEANQVFRFDNYMTILKKLHPKIFKNKKFATHEDGTVPNDWHLYNVPITDLPTSCVSDWIKREELSWIVNIDIDYFFTKNSKDEYFQFLSDDYVMDFANQIKLSMDKIKVITIALSPSFCRSFEESNRVANIIYNKLKE